MTPEKIDALPYRLNVGIMLIDANNAVFVGRRLDNPVDAWQMPQGGIDDGEDPMEAALRELEEETGVSRDLVVIEAVSDKWIAYDLPAEIIPKFWNGAYRGQKQKWFLLRYQGSDADVNIATEHPEFSHWKWCPVDQLVDNIVPFKRDVYAAVIAEFKAFL